MTTLARQQQRQMSRSLLPNARRVVLPAGIASTSAPRILAVAERLGLSADPWQQEICRITFGKQASGQYASEIVGMSIPRQAGKTYIVTLMMFALCLVEKGITVAWTAHHNKVMLETFTSLKSMASDQKVAPHIARTPSGAEYRAIEFTNGSRIVMAARESGALRGVANVSVLVLDEAQILTENALSDILPTQNVAKNPLTIMLGTPPRPKDPGEVFTQQRNQALEAEKAGEPLELASWIEFSADDDAETDDLDQWAKANPSFPERTPEKAIRKLRRALSEDHFRREALGIWDDKSTPSVIPPTIWGECLDEDSAAFERLILAIDINPLRTHASVALAGLRADGLTHVELDHATEGVDWVVEWVANRFERNPIVSVVVDSRSPAASLIPDLKQRKVRVTQTTTDDMVNACADFFDAAISRKLRHIGQHQLTGSLNSARKRSIGDRWAWNRQTQDSDITPIVAATLAHWGVHSRKVKGGSPGRQASTGRRGFVG